MVENINLFIDSEYHSLLSQSRLTISGEKRANVLEWLSDVPYQDHHKLSQGRRQEGTGQWLLQHDKFDNWRKSSQSMLWFRGNGEKTSFKSIMKSPN